MPYEVHPVEGSENCEVINADTKEVVEVHLPPDAQGKAERQVALLTEIEKEYDKGPGDGE